MNLGGSWVIKDNNVFYYGSFFLANKIKILDYAFLFKLYNIFRCYYFISIKSAIKTNIKIINDKFIIIIYQ